MLKLYKFLSYIFIPIILLNLNLRIIKKKEDKKRYKERLGKTNYKLPISKKIIWLHAASIGEFKSSDIIIKKYHKDYQILVTTTTKTSAEYIEKHYNHKVIHQYIPFDVPIWCIRFINYWKPSIVLWIESDIWPNMLKIIKDKKIKSLYINARISPKSFNKWKYLKSFYSETLKVFFKIFAQSKNDLKRINALATTNAHYIGNLKLSDIQRNLINSDNKKIFNIMITSSHETEEELIIKNLKDIIISRKLKLCIAPRHLNRINVISKILEKYNLSYVLESNKKNAIKDVTIVDSYGNLDSYFNKSEIVILGGSFVNKGGHNPLEPAKYGCTLISGNLIYNWQNIYDEMANEKACIIINNVNDLGNRIDKLMINNNQIQKFREKAIDFSNKKFFDNERLFNEIDLVLN